MEESIKQYLQPGKKNILLIYASYLGSIIIPFLSLIGAYFAFKNTGDKNKFLRSHYVLALRTFLICAVVIVVMVFFTIIGLGITLVFDSEVLFYLGGIVAMLVYYALFIWVVVRSIIAVKLVVEDKEHPNPLTFWIK